MIIHGCGGPTCQVCAIERNPTDPKTLVRSNGSATSRVAAVDAPVTELEVLVYQAISASGEHGMTQDELLDTFPNLSYSSVTARPAALKRKGIVIDSGRTRPGKSGRQQTVLVDGVHVQTTLL